MRKFFAISIILVLIAGLALGGLYLWDEYGTSEIPIQQNEGEPKAEAISDDRVVSPVVQGSSQSVVYSSRDGHIYKRSLTDDSFTELPLPAMPQNSVGRVSWSPVGSGFIAVSYVNNSPLIFNYNDNTKKYTTLPANIIDFDWLPDGMRIALVWQSSDKKSNQLVVSNADASGYRKVASLPSSHYKIRVSRSGSEAILISAKLGAADNKIYSVDLESGNYKVLVGSGNSLDARWIDSNRLLYTQQANPYPRLYLYDLSSGSSLDLGVNADLNRIGYDFFSKKIVAAVRQPDSLSDKIVKVDLVTAVAEDYYAANNLAIAQIVSANYVLYVDSLDGKLYQVK